jgi:hypothetical protein
VMEFADNGDLLQMIEKNEQNGCLLDEESFIWPVFISMVKALKQLH